MPQSTPEPSMIESIFINDITLDRSFYYPNEPIVITIEFDSVITQPTSTGLKIVIMHLADIVDELWQTITLTGEEQTVQVTYKPRLDAPSGYGIDLCFESELEKQLACGATAFDVLDHWTQTPRYGFLSEFSPGRSDSSQVMENLTRYHINGLQFYDWMYRHDQLLTNHDPYLDPLGRQLSRETVDNLIKAAHERNIAAMPYTAIYAASIPFFEEHPDWALYEANGKPNFFGENFLVYMDPRPDSPWMNHLFDQFDQVLNQTGFDGIHLDQYGDPKEGFDSQGNEFSLAEPLAASINKTKELVLSHDSKGSVVFNAVTNWPVETVAPSDQDFVYIEVWPPYIWYSDLHDLITQAQHFGEGKPVILAAYVDPSHESNVRIMDSIIFASGGGHIELGEQNGMLADPYFPKYGTMTSDFASVIQRYYDFVVRYQEVIGPRSQEATKEYLRRIELDGVSTSPSQMMNKIWPIVRQGDGFTAINLINLLGIESPEWADPLDSAPTPLGETAVRILNIDHEISRIWLASPDWTDSSPQILTFTIGDENILTFEIPSLIYWDLIVIEWDR
jgi:dextranase